jgi:hypothetical protein
MSDVERFYTAVCAKWPSPQPPWNELHPQRQMIIVQSLQLMIQAMSMPNE